MGLIYSGKPLLGAWVWWTSTVGFGDLYVRQLLPSLTTMADTEALATSLGQANVRYLVTDTPPPANLSGSFTQVYSSGMFTVWEDPRWRPFVETSPPSSPTWRRLGNGEMVVDVRTDANTLVTVRESYGPNWKAYVDGNPVVPTLANNAFVGVAVGPGEHHILLRLEQPRAVLAGRVVTGALGAALLGALAASVIMRSRARARWRATPSAVHTP